MRSKAVPVNTKCAEAPGPDVLVWLPPERDALAVVLHVPR